MVPDSISRNITETGLQGGKGSSPGVFVVAIQISFAFASFIGNVLITRIIHILPDSRLRKTTKIHITFVSFSHCILSIAAVGRQFNMPCLLVLFSGSSSGFNILCGLLFLAFEAFILVKKPHNHTHYISVKICISQILFSCIMTLGFDTAMYLTQKDPDDISLCYITNGILNPWVLGLPTCLLVAIIIIASVIQISTLRTLRKTSPIGTNTAPSHPSNLQAVPNPTVHPTITLQQILSNVQVVPNSTVHQPRVPQEMPSNVQVVPCTTASLHSALQGMSTKVIELLNPTVDPSHVPQETSNVQSAPNCTVNPHHVPQEVSLNVQSEPNCTVDPAHVPQETLSNVQSVPNCTVGPAHIPQESSSNVQSVPNCTVDRPHFPQQTTSNLQVVSHCTIHPCHVPQQILSNVQMVPNCTVDSPQVPQEKLSNVQVVPNCTVHPPHVPQANSRRMSPLHKLTVILSISLLCYIICWLPLCLAFIIFSLLEILEIEVSVEGKLITALSGLALLNGMLHVAVYVVMSTQIRQALKKYVKSWWCLG